MSYWLWNYQIKKI